MRPLGKEERPFNDYEMLSLKGLLSLYYITMMSCLDKGTLCINRKGHFVTMVKRLVKFSSDPRPQKALGNPKELWISLKTQYSIRKNIRYGSFKYFHRKMLLFHLQISVFYDFFKSTSISVFDITMRN
jgi:hypothetical protein